MMKGTDRKSLSDELAKKLFLDLESQSENEQSTVKKTLKSPKTLPRRQSPLQNKIGKSSGYLKSPSTKKIKEYISAKRRSASQKSLDQTAANASVNLGSDDEVTFNFRAKSASTSDMFVERPEQNDQRKSTFKKVTPSAKGGTQTRSRSRKAAVVPKPDDDKMEVETSPNSGEKRKAESLVADVNQAKGEAKTRNDKVKRPRRRKKKSKKETDQKTEIPPKKSVTSGTKKPAKSEEIFFYCGNLPPGVTPETLRYFLNEEGIHCRVRLQTLKHKVELLRKLTLKQLKYNKNQKIAAKAVFGTVIVKTEEDAKKMQSLNGVAMPSTTRLDWDTNLKIVRRLPRPNKYPFKVHVGGLHPTVTEEDLKSYLQSRGVKPGVVVIIRRPKNQKSKGFGFVWFESVPDADVAVDLPDPILMEQKMVIEHSFKKKFKNF